MARDFVNNIRIYKLVVTIVLLDQINDEDMIHTFIYNMHKNI